MAMATMYLHEALEYMHEPYLEDFPIFDEAHRDELRSKILENFMNREIGQETVSMHVYAVNRKMRQIMPFYNQLFATEKLKFDPLNTIDLRTFTESEATAKSVDSTTANADEESTSDSDSDSTSKTVNYSFPQDYLAGNKDYASSAQDGEAKSKATSKANGKTSSTQNGESDSTQDGKTDSTATGFQGNRSALLQDYRATILNIDMDIIRELEDCFYQVFSSGDSFVNESRYF